MNLSELWTGEKVRIKSSGRIGRFQGVNNNGKARIKSEEKIFLVNLENLEVLPESEYFPNMDEFLNQDSIIQVKSKPLNINFNSTLDLHIDKLAPEKQNDTPGRIMDYQLQQSQNFIEEAIRKKYPHITIIHGKGQGVLKNAIEHQLSQYNEVRFTFSKNGGGAVEIWL
ncbi:MAG: Smr/MutS family protein [Saprospiraceae bacterium]|jgi:dsDNA-specific endonuclease/ATPase MutS2|nr:Smr/MutS family protein [Saprospiraceae bacterium]